MRRFVDASVFVHAYLKPTRTLRAHEQKLKADARRIVTRIQGGEVVTTSAVQVAEIANLLEAWIPLADARAIVRELCTRDTLEILPTDRGDLLDAVAVAEDADVGTSDAIAAVLMRGLGLTEIYSFDRDFDRIGGLRRVSE